MLACRTTQTLLRAPRRILAQPLACYSNKADIPKDNMFWMKHQIDAKPGFHAHINQVDTSPGIPIVQTHLFDELFLGTCRCCSFTRRCYWMCRFPRCISFGSSLCSYFCCSRFLRYRSHDWWLRSTYCSRCRRQGKSQGFTDRSRPVGSINLALNYDLQHL